MPRWITLSSLGRKARSVHEPERTRDRVADCPGRTASFGNGRWRGHRRSHGEAIGGRWSQCRRSGGPVGCRRGSGQFDKKITAEKPSRLHVTWGIRPPYAPRLKQLRTRLAASTPLVAAAAISVPSTTLALTIELWNTLLRVNLTGVFLTVKETLPYLLEAGGGSVVTLGSMASFVAAGESSAYDASKGGVLQFTKSIAVEYSDRNIRANCVCPGRTTTELGANSRELTTLRSDEPKAPGSTHAYIPISRSC